MPVLAYHANALKIVHGDHRRGAGMADQVDVVLAAVRIEQALGGDLNNAAAMPGVGFDVVGFNMMDLA